MNQAKERTRLNRETWLQQALETLAEDPTHLRIDELAARLGVSKGSFYWHFEGRSDFVRGLAEYWRDTNTIAVAESIAQVEGTAEDRLYALMRQILANKAAKYDLAVRAWARHEPDILPVIREVDDFRLKTLRALFKEMGFEEPELGVRTRVFVACHSFEDALAIQMSRDEVLAQLDARHAFFTRR